ncbi:uncharacterized protein LTR77_005380 [Saxophila tyrrhenica]|uniref:Uncharacterized protein n=1 Tax=Saxophila tyrrhenica TaxID=1690608 RepID=A0AAV9PCK2_9PEZI|nr:hypothetical protein LTR77_005380 [Saxophila tyrrhenica]
MILFLPETYGPTILGWKASALRRSTRDSRYRGPLESATATSFGRKLYEALQRPTSILVTEPIVMVLTAYLTFVYIVSFSFFTGAPFIFTGSYGFDQGSAYLMFVSMVIGRWVYAVCTPLYGILIGREYKKAAAEGKAHAEPEAMLWWAMIAAPILPTCLFRLAWSDFPSVSYWSPIVACAFFGFSLLSVFLSIYVYLIQAFTRYAASALVAVTLVRYTLGGCMVIVAMPTYRNLGDHHATTILAAVAASFTPVPFLLYFKGQSIRGASRRIGKSQV